MMNDKKTLEISQNLCYNYIYDIDYAGILLDVNLLFIHVAAVVLMLSPHRRETDYMENSLRIIFNRGSRLLCTGGFFCYVRDDIMIKLICDKCGKDYTDEFSIPDISLNMPLLPTLVMNSGKNSCTTYLCDECAKQVYNFIFGEKPEE